MWSYYADEFKCVCIAVDVAEEKLMPVEYFNSIPTLDEDKDDAEKFAIQALTAKLNYWKHEAEIRALVSYGSSQLECKVVGVLHGKNISERNLTEITAIANELGACLAEVNIELDSLDTRCLGFSTNIRPVDIPLEGWLHTGAGSLSGWVHPAKSCQICSSLNTEILEPHFIRSTNNGGSLSPQNTSLLCPTCHQIEHRAPQSKNRDLLEELNHKNL